VVWATPLASVNVTEGEVAPTEYAGEDPFAAAEADPADTLQYTETPSTGAPELSRTRTTTGSGRVVPTTPFWPSPAAAWTTEAALAATLTHPPAVTPPEVALISAEPSATAEAIPAVQTEATAVFELLQVTVAPVTRLPNSSRAVAARGWVSPGFSSASLG
jgi:hypothetical protein